MALEWSRNRPIEGPRFLRGAGCGPRDSAVRPPGHGRPITVGRCQRRRL